MQVCSKWPVEHRDHYERLAREQGISLNEYLVRFMAAGHGFIVPPDSASPDRQELPTGA